MYTLGFILNLSRPRFWLYLAGMYWVGTTVGITSFEQAIQPWSIIVFLYFLLPANIYLYGINDYFDRDTDARNAKKGKKEIKVTARDLPLIRRLLFITTAITVLLIFLVPSFMVKLLLIGFFILSTGYSAPPLRFKAKPFLDFASNFLYAIPGIIGYITITNAFPPWPALVALFCWTSAMHIFSAIPDIQADTKAGLITTAVYLGKPLSLWLCFVFWTIAASIPLFYDFAFPLSLLLWIYPLLILGISITRANIERIYWWFPYITGTLGFISYWYFIVQQLL